MPQEKKIPPKPEPTSNSSKSSKSTDEKSKSEALLSGVIASALVEIGKAVGEFIVETAGKLLEKKLSGR